MDRPGVDVAYTVNENTVTRTSLQTGSPTANQKHMYVFLPANYVVIVIVIVCRMKLRHKHHSFHSEIKSQVKTSHTERTVGPEASQTSYVQMLKGSARHQQQNKTQHSHLER